MPEDEQTTDDPETTEGVYNEEAREEMVDDDELEPWEEGFVEGADADGQLGKCANCGGMLTEENCVEKKMDGKLKRFCCEDCFELYEEKHED